MPTDRNLTTVSTNTDDTSTRSWDAIADDWAKHADANDYRNHFLLPRMLDMIGDVRGRTILDLGCGEGAYARELARRGAQVTAVDGSERLVEIATARASRDDVDVHHVRANMSAMDGVPSGAFDLVVAAMSLMDAEDYEGAIRETHRVLAPGGELVMSISHPCFSARVSEWVRDANGHPRFFAVDRYFERTPWDAFVARAFSATVVRRHRPLEDYLGALLQNDFVLREFREPTVAAEELRKSERFEQLTRIPYFLFMRWQKGK